MPIYNFHCNSCGTDFEDLVANRGDISPCPECSSENVVKGISKPAPHQTKGAMEFPSCSSGACGCTPESCPHLMN